MLVPTLAFCIQQETPAESAFYDGCLAVLKKSSGREAVYLQFADHGVIVWARENMPTMNSCFIGGEKRMKDALAIVKANKLLYQSFKDKYKDEAKVTCVASGREKAQAFASQLLGNKISTNSGVEVFGNAPAGH